MVVNIKPSWLVHYLSRRLKLSVDSCLGHCPPFGAHSLPPSISLIATLPLVTSLDVARLLGLFQVQQVPFHYLGGAGRVQRPSPRLSPPPPTPHRAHRPAALTLLWPAGTRRGRGREGEGAPSCCSHAAARSPLHAAPSAPPPGEWQLMPARLPFIGPRGQDRDDGGGLANGVDGLLQRRLPGLEDT